MEDTLSAVIEAEKEIQKCIELEKVKVRQWLESVKQKSAEEFLREKKKIKEAQEQWRAEATKEADRKSAEIMANAARVAKRIAELNDKALQDIIERKIRRILAG